MSTYIENKPKVTTRRLLEMKQKGEKIACITAYDYTMARLVDNAGIDLILVGDSAANVMAGYQTTIPITLDEMITYAKGVVRGVSRSMVVVDMPFGSYQTSPEEAVRSAVRIMKETGAEAVKLEGGAEIAEHIRLIIAAGIPVVGHLGLTPQSVNVFGGYGVRAKDEKEARKFADDCRLLQELGCCAIVFEKIPAALAASVTAELSVPTIGIGAGSETDGQIIVLQDMLGMNEGFKPKFLRLYGNFGREITDAINHYVTDVKAVDFPNADERY